MARRVLNTPGSSDMPSLIQPATGRESNATGPHRGSLRRAHRLNPPTEPAPTAVIALALLLLLLLATLGVRADDWPQWMGPRRDGVWRESRILRQFDTNGPPVLWRAEVGSGYVGPAVADGRLFLVDRQAGSAPQRARGDRSPIRIPGTERVLCLDPASGRTLWEQRYDCPYSISYPAGPRATPLVDGRRVFTLGAMGHLQCWRTTDGSLLWSVDLPGAFACEPPAWGYAAHPLLVDGRLIVPVGGKGSALVAFDADTGRELWRALDAQEIGYAPPILRREGRTREVVFWHPDAVTGLDPTSGQVRWSHPYPVGGKPQRPEVTIALPRLIGDRDLFLTSFYQGSLLLRLPRSGEEPRVVWNRRSAKQSEMTDGLHTVLSTPFIQDRHVYGICAFGELRCLDLASGDRVWESPDLFPGKGGFFAHAFVVDHGDRQWFWTDQGDLVLGSARPEGFQVHSRAHILDPVESTRGRDVLWCHPAFAGRRLFVHNGRTLVCLNLAAS